MMPTDEPKARRIHGEVAVVILAALMGLLAAVSHFTWDERAMAWLAESGTNWRKTWPLQALALLGKSELQIWILLVWFCAGRRRARPVLAALAAILLLGLLVPLLKFTVHRMRPVDTPPIVRLDPGRQEDHAWYTNGSFPSGDAATACGMAVALGCATTWPWLPTLLIVGAGVGTLRVASFVHYPSDVLAGAALGMCCAWLALRALQRRRLPEWTGTPLSRQVAAAGAVAVSLVILLSHNTRRAVLFLAVYVLPVVVLYLVRRTIRRRQRPAADMGDGEPS